MLLCNPGAYEIHIYLKDAYVGRLRGMHWY